MNNDVTWYSRFGDIPGVSYETPPGLDVKRLPGYGSVPEVRRLSDSDAYLLWSESLQWSDTGGGSPAAQRARHDDNTRMPGSWLLKRIQETLELPGAAGDYHFAIAGFAESFYSRRYREPEWLATVEWLCWLDIQLIEARSDAFLVDRGKQPDNYYRFPVLSRLITMYSAEGYLREALRVVEHAERFGQGGDHREKLLARIANVEVEDEQ